MEISRPHRVVVVVLTIFLLGLLLWMMVAGVGDWRTRMLVAVGALLGIIQLIGGGFSKQALQLFGVEDEDSSSQHISPSVYLPIILLILLSAFIALAVGLFA